MQLLIVLCFVLVCFVDAHGLFWSPTSRARLAKESGWTTDATSIISEPMPDVASGRPYPGGRPFAEPGKSMSNVGPCGMETYDSKKTNWNMPAHSWGSTQAQYTSGDTIDVSWCVSNLADHGTAALLLYLPLTAVCQGVFIRIGCALMTILSLSLLTRLTHQQQARWINWRCASRRAYSSAPTCLARIVLFILTAKTDGAVSKPTTGNTLMVQTDCLSVVCCQVYVWPQGFRQMREQRPKQLPDPSWSWHLAQRPSQAAGWLHQPTYADWVSLGF